MDQESTFELRRGALIELLLVALGRGWLPAADLVQIDINISAFISPPGHLLQLARYFFLLILIIKRFIGMAAHFFSSLGWPGLLLSRYMNEERVRRVAGPVVQVVILVLEGRAHVKCI